MKLNLHICLPFIDWIVDSKYGDGVKQLLFASAIELPRNNSILSFMRKPWVRTSRQMSSVNKNAKCKCHRLLFRHNFYSISFGIFIFGLFMRHFQSRYQTINILLSTVFTVRLSPLMQPFAFDTLNGTIHRCLRLSFMLLFCTLIDRNTKILNAFSENGQSGMFLRSRIFLLRWPMTIDRQRHLAT